MARRTPLRSVLRSPTRSAQGNLTRFSETRLAMLALASGAKVLFSDEWVRGNEILAHALYFPLSDFGAGRGVKCTFFPSPTVRTWMLWDYEEPGHV